jgi:hypothetical protein
MGGGPGLTGGLRLFGQPSGLAGLGFGHQFDAVAGGGAGRICLDDVRIGLIAIDQGLIAVATPQGQGQGIEGVAQSVAFGRQGGGGGGGVADVAQPHNEPATIIGVAGDGLDAAAAVGRLDGHGEPVAAGSGTKRVKGAGQARGVVMGEAGDEIIEPATGLEAEMVGEIGGSMVVAPACAPVAPDAGGGCRQSLKAANFGRLALGLGFIGAARREQPEQHCGEAGSSDDGADKEHGGGGRPRPRICWPTAPIGRPGRVPGLAPSTVDCLNPRTTP